MFAEWIVGLLAALVATPVAVASYLSAYHAAADERRSSQRIRAPHRVPALAQTHAAHHHQYRRHIAA